MAPTIEDRWLFLGLGVFAFFAVKGVAQGLRHVRELTRVNTPPPPPSIPSPHNGVDSIKTSSLETLATCDNVDIRKAATEILCERFMSHSGVRARLRKDLRSRNPHVQRRASLAYNLLLETGVMHQVAMNMPVHHASGVYRSLGRTVPRERDNLPSGWGFLRAQGRARSSDEERVLRRRRREAVVINEGDRPISREDVFMRDEEGRMSVEEPRSGGGEARGLNWV